MGAGGGRGSGRNQEIVAGHAARVIINREGQKRMPRRVTAVVSNVVVIIIKLTTVVVVVVVA